MIINGSKLLIEGPIKNMIGTKEKAHGVSYGLSEVGYDIRIKQRVVFIPPNPITFLRMQEEKAIVTDDYYRSEYKQAFFGSTMVFHEGEDRVKSITYGRTALASSVEEFQVPGNLWGELRNKSTHARRFIDATIGTDMEPGWKGFLTIELIFHGNEAIDIPAGSGIAKVVFHELKNWAQYEGKYDNQPDRPVLPILV